MEKFKKQIQVTKAFLPPLEEYVEEIKNIWSTNWLTNNGDIHNDLEKKLQEYLGIKNSTLFTNGHLAMEIAIKSLNLTGEVITTPFTFASTTHAIVNNGLTPIFCDIKIDDFTIDENKIESLITSKTSAIIPVHVFGYPCNVKRIEKIANKYNLKVIYDAAHTFGVEIEGVGIGNFGDVSMFSLHATKVFHTIEGGILSTNNKELRQKVNLLKNFGISGPESVESVGINAKMNEFQAAMGIVNLRYIDKEIEKRQKIANIYRDELRGIKGISFLNDKKNIKHNYSYFPIIVDEKAVGISRNELHEKLKEYNVFTRKYFYPLITEFECYKGKFNDCNLNNSKYLAERVLTLPMYSELNSTDVVKIVEIIKTIIEENG